MQIKYRLLSLFLLFPLFLGGQNLVQRTLRNADTTYMNYRYKRANKNFGNMAYVRAIEKYETLLGKGYEDDSLKRYLATAYYKTGNTVKSEELFREVLTDTPYVASDVYLLAQSLKYNRKYKESDRWIAVYRQLMQNDSRGSIQYNAADKLNTIASVDRYRVEAVNFNSKESDFGAVVMGDKVVFATARNDEKIVNRDYAWNESPYLDLYVTPKDGGILTSTHLLSSRLTSAYHDGPAAFSSDGKEVFFTRNSYLPVMPHSKTNIVENVDVLNKVVPKKGQSGITNLMIEYSKKDAMGQWNYPEPMPFCSVDYSCGQACLAPDDSTLYFASDMPGGYGGTDIYYVIRTDTGWTAPVNLGKDINTEGEEMFPFVNGNGYLYFSSNGWLSLGGLDVFVAKKTATGYQLKNMGAPLNTNKDDFSFYLEQDNVHGYFASNREGGVGDDDIYSFEILNPVTFNLKLQGTVADSADGHFLDHATVSLQDASGEELSSFKTGEGHAFEFEIEPGKDYRLEVRREDYFAREELVVPAEMEQDNGTVHQPVLLRQEPFYGIYGKVYQLPEMESISQVELVLEAHNGTDSVIVTGESGAFKTKLLKDMDYDLVFRKNNFFTKRVRYSTVDKDTGYVNLNEYIPQMGVEKVELGKSIELEILYDLGKWNIREDAAKELDDMVRFLQDNPGISIELGSHTDSRGSSRSNQVLSQKRAESAVQYMVDKGIANDRITAKGYGETHLKNRCADGVSCTEAEHQANRRTEAKVTGMK